VAAGSRHVKVGSMDATPTAPAHREARHRRRQCRALPAPSGRAAPQHFEGPVDLVQERVIETDGVAYLHCRVTRYRPSVREDPGGAPSGRGEAMSTPARPTP